jgi:MFS family permease
MFLGAFNDNFLKNALIILIAFKAHQVLGMGPSQMVVLAGGIFILPFFLFSATSGQIADKFEKTKIIHLIKFAEILIMALACYGFIYEQFAFLMLVLFLMGTHSAFFGPVKYSILPQHLNADEILAGNALIEAGTFLAILLGTICGGVLIAIESSGTHLVGFGLMIVAVAGFAVSQKILKAPPVDPNIQIEWNPITPTFKVFQIAKQNSAVLYSVYSISWFWFFGACLLSLFPIYSKNILNGNESVVTFLLAIFSVGIGIGSMLCEKISGQKTNLGLVVLGCFGMSLFSFDLFLTGQPEVFSQISSQYLNLSQFIQEWSAIRIIFDLLMIATFGGFFIVPLYTLIQERSQPHLRSRVIAANNVLNALFMVIASLMLMQLLKNNYSVPQIFLILSILNLIFMLIIFTKQPEFISSFKTGLRSFKSKN